MFVLWGFSSVPTAAQYQVPCWCYQQWLWSSVRTFKSGLFEWMKWNLPVWVITGQLYLSLTPCSTQSPSNGLHGIVSNVLYIYKNCFLQLVHLEWNMSLCKCNIFHKAHFNILFYWLSVYQAPVWNIFLVKHKNATTLVLWSLFCFGFIDLWKKIWNVWFTSYAWKSKKQNTPKNIFSTHIMINYIWLV